MKTKEEMNNTTIKELIDTEEGFEDFSCVDILNTIHYMMTYGKWSYGDLISLKTREFEIFYLMLVRDIKEKNESITKRNEDIMKRNEDIRNRDK